MTDASESIRVLHVDDEPGFAAVAADCLERESGRLAVETATGADEGIAHLCEHRVDCIVSDYDMPGENGIEFLERIRETDPNLPFVLFTGKGSEEIASDAISAGVTEYLQKETGTGQYAVLANRIENAVEQYRTKHEIEASQKRLSLFIEQSPLGVLEYDEDFEIVRLNERGEEILGYTEAELRGHTWETLVTEGSYENVDAVTDELAAAEGGYHSVDENVRKDGEKIVCEWHNRVVTDDDGEVVAVFSQFQDVTDRRNREERLRRTTARLEALFENSPDGIGVHDAEGTVVDANPQLCEQTGYGEAELIGMKIWEVDARADPEEAVEVWAGMSVGDRREIETRYRRADGTTFPVEVHVRRLSIDGEERFVAISRDITERRRREAEREPVDLAAATKRHWERVETADATLVVEADRVVEADPSRLAKLFENLFRNSIEHGSAGARAHSDDPGHGDDTVTITVGELDDCGGFFVADDGPGIPEADREHVFEAGYSDADGTGFGLAIVEGIAAAHGWEIAVGESEAGGARFEITGVDEPAGAGGGAATDPTQ